MMSSIRNMYVICEESFLLESSMVLLNYCLFSLLLVTCLRYVVATPLLVQKVRGLHAYGK